MLVLAGSGLCFRMDLSVKELLLTSQILHFSDKQFTFGRYVARRVRIYYSCCLISRDRLSILDESRERPPLLRREGSGRLVVEAQQQ